jgi:hypothetical protein
MTSVPESSAQCGTVEIIKQSRNKTAFLAMLHFIVSERGVVCPGIEARYLESLGLDDNSLLFTAARLDDPGHLCSFSILKTVLPIGATQNTLVMQLICSARGLDYGRIVLARIILYGETEKHNISEIKLEAIPSAVPFYLRHGFMPYSAKTMYKVDAISGFNELFVEPDNMAALSEQGWKVEESGGLLTLVRQTSFYRPYFDDIDWE